MAIYQCFFFSRGRVSFWENIESDGSMRLTASLRDRLKNGKWQHAEAWSDGKLVCDVRRRRSNTEGASRFESLCSEPCGLESSARDRASGSQSDLARRFPQVTFPGQLVVREQS